MVAHTSVNNHISNQLKAFHFDDLEKVLLLAEYVFDAAVEQIYIALLSGSMLWIPTKEEKHDSDILSEKIKAHAITHIHGTPSFLSLLKKEIIDLPIRFISGAEELPARVFNYFHSQLMNEYGPTETTVTSVQWIPSDNCFITERRCPIGKPIQNTRVYVLDQFLKPVSLGVVGELYIGGAGVARGYLNRPDLTAERFIENPFASESDKAKGYTRLYKTGDLVKWLPDGNLEYMGRNDFQVKIRGFRIELGEIESSLSHHPEIKDARK